MTIAKGIIPAISEMNVPTTTVPVSRAKVSCLSSNPFLSLWDMHP